MWKVYILTTENGRTTGFERTTGGEDLFVDWGMLAQQYPFVCLQGVQYLVLTTEAGTWLVSEPLAA